MFLQLSLLLSIFLLFLPLAFSSILIAKSGCPDRCGNLSIPFPFGVGSDCSLERSFNISCNTSTNPPKAYLKIYPSYEEVDIEVIDINLSGQIRVEYPNLVSACYDDQRENGSDYQYFELLGSQYTLSEENWLTAYGCDDMMAVRGLVNGSLNLFKGSYFVNGSLFGGGCISYCERRERDSGGYGYCAENGYGLGSGCCRIPIPKGTTTLLVNLTDVHEKWRRSKKLFSCSYAFLEEKGMWNQSVFSYPLKSLNDSMVSSNDYRIVALNWRIGAENCSQARRNSTTFACKENSDCFDFDVNVGGYLCSCRKGFKGNPYRTGGCQDIDECEDSMTNPCTSNSICINTFGSVNCSCPRGYYGDGKRHGTRCTRIPLSKVISVSLGVGSGLGFLLLLSMCFWLRKILQKRKNKMNKEKFFERNGGLLLRQQIDEGTLGKVKLFPSKELETATDHFSESRILGQGGQGTVYKGMLSDGQIVAIKKLKVVDEDQLKQFINEVAILSQINHRNVVKLLGCCLESEVPLLAYEFVPNGTLFDLIHDPNTEFPFSWDRRLKIAADVAGAVAYLHSASSIPIYHRDIKSSNILLDEKYIVKVSDFGTSKSFEVDQTHLTTMVKGTIGYLDPEYFQSSQFTEKSDVYSFGVVLVELLTRQRPMSLVTRFLSSMEANNLDSILDPQVMEQAGRKEEVISVARLAQRCLNLKGKMRPTMKEVATELESWRISQMPVAVKDEHEEERVCEAKAIMISDNEYTWTTSGNSFASSSSDTRPLKFGTM